MPPSSIILFDGYCHLCSRSVRFIKKRDTKKVFSFVPRQTQETVLNNNFKDSPNQIPASIILLENGKSYQMSDAVLRISRQLRFPWNLFIVFIIVPRFIRDWVYMLIARNRYKWFGRRESCYID